MSANVVISDVDPVGLGKTARLVEERDIALCVLYLAADTSRSVIGQIVRPNGGTAMP